MPSQQGYKRLSTTEEDVVKSYRAACPSRALDAISEGFTAVSRAQSRLLSQPVVAASLRFCARMRFICNFLLDGLVAQALIEKGCVAWGWSVIAFMLLPYAAVVAALLPVASKRLAAEGAGGIGASSLVWLLGGVPACFAADVYLSLRYLCQDPQRVEEFHYMTLRGSLELLEAIPQLLLQGYLAVLQWIPSPHGPGHVVLARWGGGLKPLDDHLLAASLGVSAFTAFEMSTRLHRFAGDQCGGSVRRFLRQMSQLSEGLAPSELFDQLRWRTRVVIPYDLQGVGHRAMRCLCIVASRAAQLEELIFENTRWVVALEELHGHRIVEEVLTGFAEAPSLRRLELRGDGLPSWVARCVETVAGSHFHLADMVIGQRVLQHSFVKRLGNADPLLRAAQQGDLEAVRRIETKAPLYEHAEALSVAASLGSLELLRAVLLQPGGFDAVHLPGAGEESRERRLPLHFAARADHGPVVGLLLAAQADADAMSGSYRTPLHFAARYDCVKAVRELLAARADVDFAYPGGSPLLLASMQNSIGSVELLLAAQADPNKPDMKGRTPVAMAAKHDSAHCLRRLLRARGNPDVVGNDGATPLSLAVQQNCIESLHLLLGARADPNDTDSEGTTPLHVAAKGNLVDCIRLLLGAKGAVNRAATDDEGHVGPTPLLVAAEENQAESLRVLLAYRADINKAKEDGRTPLSSAARRGSEECLQLLLAARVNADQATPDGVTPLVWAIYGRSAACLEALLRAKADPSHAEVPGLSPLAVAEEMGQKAVAAALRRAGASS